MAVGTAVNDDDDTEDEEVSVGHMERVGGVYTVGGVT